MAIDGRFCLQYELKRFLSRCPKLACIPQFQLLVEKEQTLTEEEVVNSMAQLFIHPKYTIPIVGCFRPIAKKIADKTVDFLHKVHNLGSNFDDFMGDLEGEKFLQGNDDSNSEEVVNVIDFHVSCRRGLNLHELACLAFSRAVDLAPYLSGSVLNYFNFAPPPFKRIIQRESVSELLVKAGTHLLNIFRVSYRLLLSDPEVFSTLWDWSYFSNLVQQLVDHNPGDCAELSKIFSDVRWCAIQILSVVLKISDRASKNFGCGAEEAFACLLRWQEFCQDVSLEKAGCYFEPVEEQKLTSINGGIYFSEDSHLQSFDLSCSSVSSSMIDQNEPSIWNGGLATRDVGSTGDPFILTSAVKKGFEMVLLAVNQKWPVLLHGPAGSGKTSLIKKLARDNGSRVLHIHMDELIDGKTLIGSYVCAEQPGEFRWQPGSLTQAVLNGYWVVFEDVDNAPSDVHSILLPLLEGANSFLTGHAEAIRVAEGFRLFSTISSSRLEIFRTGEGGNLLGALWRKVMIGPSSNEDLLSIVKAWYPDLELLADKLIETLERVNRLAAFQFGGYSFGSLTRFSLRDLLKWCKRISGLGFRFDDNGLSTFVYNSIFVEAVDVFASFSSSPEIRLVIMKEIAKIWSVEPLFPVNKPIIQESKFGLHIGRITFQLTKKFCDRRKPFVELRNSVHVLERLACSVKYNEPVLLVGETGTGKTTIVQNLAMRLGRKLTVLNLSQQSDVADLLGGFKPMNSQFICIPLYKEFEKLFVNTFSQKRNDKFLLPLRKCASDKNWKDLLRGFQKGVEKVAGIGRCGSGTKRKRDWENFSLKLEAACAQLNALSGMIFSFVEGAFVTALKNGDWILLDEVNLAPPETLQRVIGVLEEENGSICLAERGDADYIPRHPNFRIFACMNPATDAGKRDLPFSLRSRFTEYFVDDVLEDEDLILFINQCLEGSHLNRDLVNKIVRFYKAAKKESEERLQDGANQKPQYSLRSLYRAVEYTNMASKEFKFQKALYDGFCMFFLTLLDEPSARFINQMILSYLLGGEIPSHVPFSEYLKKYRKFNPGGFMDSYVLTKTVKEHLRNLARAIFIRRYPVLLQGPTSSGKTSLVQYLAAITGHEFVRINNHEHTDLQEYLGSYVTDATGKLVFQEGVLVKAVRNGYWIVLDELNLAPSDVLEALNRLLDDNRELFVPELNELVHAHQDFMLFATQNPPTFYGGRKMLSRAFRNRFVEIHVDEIPEIELCTIVEKRCHISATHAKKMVEVMKELQLRRQSSKIFAGKHGFITPRDLFRWANRFRTFGNSYEDLAREGYYLLAERLRDKAEKSVVQEVLERLLLIKLAEEDLYKQEQEKNDKVLNLCKYSGVSENFGKIIWTESMWRLYFLVEHSYKLREPVLLVGETGGGKTTVCQLLSSVFGSKLHILNCHQYTETSDFIGGFYPVRDRSKIASEFRNICEWLMLSKAFIHFHGDVKISSDIVQASMILDELSKIVNRCRRGLPHPDVTLQDLASLECVVLDLGHLHQKWQMIFMWQDGPLVQAMKNGDIFLVDEISLADDSVLERLNSVLEPEKKLSLAEKGGSDLETVTAHPNFLLLATMNPGGDYGKKELSPALRNRFTEIWVASVSELNELKSIALQRISNPELSFIVDPMLNFWEWFNLVQTGRILTVRDLLSWVDFINATTKSLHPKLAFVHGAFLILLDGLSLGTGISKSDAGKLRERCLSFLVEQLKESRSSLLYSSLSMMENYGWGEIGTSTAISCNNDRPSDNYFGIHPFYIEKGDDQIEFDKFEFLAPTTCRNTLRVLRAMQLAKPVLLEGSPGVGKTSLIVALGKFSGHTVVRINLSEQTDIMDLLGSDLPVESDEGLQFAWSDGILLQALKNGSWVLLDEINLAPQSVLEGLNAILDHRAEVYIPELGLTYKCPSSFRVFACQNPFCQGGGRKGLPKSFLNRFTKVYVDELVDDDYVMICNSLYPSIPRPLLLKLILFNKRLHEEIMLYHKFAEDGSPWEFNLRDVIRSCQIIQDAPERAKFDCFLNTVYLQRMRTAADRREVIRLYEEVFGQSPFLNPYPRVQLNRQYLIVGNTSIKRNHFQSSKLSKSELKILPGIRHSLEAVAQCVQHQWLSVLIGPASSGKTSLIRLLAQLTGNRVNELNLSPATDISELLGCFEQYNAFRDYRFVVSKVEAYINEYCSLNLESSMEAFIEIRKDWLDFLSKTDCGPSISSISAYTENWNIDSIYLLIKIIKLLRLELEKYILPVAWSCEDLDWTLKTIQKLLKNHHAGRHPAKFEWVTGLLIKAIEDGEWIVLKNANICNPTVLDRINSLVEPHGSITVNERGIVDGKPMVIHPHCQFRMFLTVNPSYGEVSRAMRNRGVEIYLMQPTWLLEIGSVENHQKTDIKEVKRFLTLSGIPVGKLVDSMANAHIYARNEVLRFNINITYLELSRWVQLFQRLLINGNRPLWSLHISWEHTYLSSFGEAEGNDVVTHVTLSFLSMTELCKFDQFLGCSLSLPGGWPTPLRLCDYIWYSKETCVKQNCMYLEFLGAEMASYMSSITWDSCPMQQVQTPDIYLIDAKKLHAILFPKASNHEVANYGVKKEFDLALAKKILFFAANWVIEQANESDHELYLCWFSWFGSHMQPFCHFFNSFLMLLKQEMKHPIWTCIIRCRNEIMSNHHIDLELKPIPILSLELVDLYASNDMPKSSSRLLRNAISSVGLLRLSLKQWNDESEYDYSDTSSLLIPLLRSLRRVEEKVLEMLVQPSSFDVLFELYADLIENHISFWIGITSSQFEQSLISWQFMVKKILKLEEFFPKEIGRLEVEIEKLVQVFHSQKSVPWVHGGHPFLPETDIKKLVQVLSLRFHSQKSLLWVHGGHPFLPSSADLYRKHHQLLQLCESIWPKKTKSLNKVEKDFLVEAAASSVPEVRFLAMKGVSSYVLGKVDEDDSCSLWEFEEMLQMLLNRFENEKNKLRARIGDNEPPSSVAHGAACCVLCSDLLCGQSGFDSWQDTLPIIDSKSYFLDMELLEELSKIVLLDAGELYAALSGLSDPLEYTLDFSLKFSSRPPTDFVPHKKLLQSLDAWTSVGEVNTKVAILELWFRWHSSLWTSFHTLDETISRTDGCVPDMLFHPVKMATVNQILKDAFAINDYHMSSLKLRVASHNLWKSSPPVPNISSFLLSTARTLFQQIIHAHRKSFEANEYAAINSILCSFQNNIMKEENVDALVSHLASSSHHGLSSLISPLIKPILGELYLQHPSTDFLHSVGCAWLRIGELRYRLLISCDDLGHSVKYSSKYSQLLEKIALHELEMEVRQECSYLAGSFSLKEAGDHRARLLENLKLQLKRLQRKIVFRSDPGKFKKLKEECEEFLKVVANPIDQTMDMEQIAVHVLNLQGKTSCFIGLLSSKFPSYMDIVQPVQVAIYEMKLGLSLVFSSALQKQFLNKIGKVDMDMVQEAIYLFMRFPRCYTFKDVHDNLNIGLHVSPFCIVDSHSSSRGLDLNLLEVLLTIKRDVIDEVVSVFQMKATIHHNILLRVAHSVADSRLIDNTSFTLLDMIFDEFAKLWISMKVQLKNKDDHEAQEYRFKSRAFKLEDVIEVDISTLGCLFANESFLEWQDLVSEEDFTERKKENEENQTLVKEWRTMQESILNNLVSVHNQLFGSIDLLQNPRFVEVSDADRLSSFIDSYTLGAGMAYDLQGLLSSSLDTKLVPEHLLRLCLEHEQKFVSSDKSTRAYNFYKDSNASTMVKMVELLAAFKQRILFLLGEWDDHPALQKILDVTEMILAIPLSTPLAKVLSGLHFLLNRVRNLRETISKFPLSDTLEPIFALVSSWQKLEFDCWPSLLNEVQGQYEVNAGKLWYPLYSVLHHRHSTDIADYNRSTVQSLDEFIQTSSIGEFRKRLQLLFAFHGQISTGICRGSYSSPCQIENMKILYNTFGFYVQFLPIILEHIEVSRRNIEMELKELLKLCHWEHFETYLSMESSKKTRQKLQKLIQKYTDVLQQPVMLVLNQEMAQSGIKVQSKQGLKLLCGSSDEIQEMLNLACNQNELRDNVRSEWFMDWRKKVDLALQSLNLEMPHFPHNSNNAKDIAITASESANFVYGEEWKHAWCAIEEICRTVIYCGDLWKDENKNLGKRRALFDLLKLLENSGLSKRISIFLEDQVKSNPSSSWFLQPSYDVQHLLLTHSRLSSSLLDVSASSQSDSLTDESLVAQWKTANEHYFKSIASIHLLRMVCQNFHKDFTLEQVNRSLSFIDHLIIIQQEQRAAAYGFAEQLRCLRKCVLPLENLFSSSSALIKNQCASFKCMWQQKQLFDCLCIMLHEECLLLKTVENNHLITCGNVKPAAERLLVFFEKYIPDFRKSKDLLDSYLLGNNRVFTEAAAVHPCVISEEMEQLVSQNFMLIKDFQECFSRLHVDGRSVEKVLLGRFEDIFKKNKLIEEEYDSALQAKAALGNTEKESNYCREKICNLETGFGEAVMGAYKSIVDAFDRVGLLKNGCAYSDGSLGDITSWKLLFELYVTNVQLDRIFDEVVKTIDCGVELVKYYGVGDSDRTALVGERLRHLYSLLILVLSFSDQLLHDFLTILRLVSVTTHLLADIFASLYSKGFGLSMEEEDMSSCINTQNATGTGMGEGAGKTDVSDQIIDEDQLLGTSEKLNEEKDALDEIPSKNEKGVEMEQDFAADTFSISEDSEDDNNEDVENEQLESAMGETQADGEIVDEKISDKTDDENLDNKNEKYEPGPSVEDRDSTGRELRGKEDPCTTADDTGELSPDEFDKQNDENDSQDNHTESMEDMNLDKEDAFADPTGLKLDEPKQGSEGDMDIDEPDSVDPMESVDQQELEESAEDKNGEENTDLVEETSGEAMTEQVGGNSESNDPANNQKENMDTDVIQPEKDVNKPNASNLVGDQVPNAEAATQPKGDLHATDLRDNAPDAKFSNGMGVQNDLASMESLPSATEVVMTMSDSSDGRLSDNQLKPQLPQHDSSALQKLQPNPCRHVGDAREDLKKGVKVSIELQENNLEAPEDVVDDNANEYGYTTEFEKGTAQALGSATAEQIDVSIDGDKPDADGTDADREDISEMEIQKPDFDKSSLKTHIRNEKLEQMEISELDMPPEVPAEIHSHVDGDTGSLSESLVSMNRTYMSEDIYQLGTLSMSDNELGRAHKLEEASGDMKNYAAMLWRRYEMLTTRLSQELAEQLRLVMEPTLASKLQGDYKTGKRINMKKVIPYIASHYRKDKIWLRRTRPSKRDYQIVIAVDDSRSMSESCCGDFAIEALVTVCRAMSQLEVGKLAVASFGKKGNIRLLHDFDKPFTGEAGIKMISSLTFKQENTIADEPMVDLLKYLNNMLDTAVVNARLPSGHNPLQQLVLIIADGRLHEKENLKRCVRDALSRKRMVAFLVLDSPKDSILDCKEASFRGGEIKFFSYLDSFPFPYYIVLRNIEALPRTLADLLRQWFELMQQSRD